MNSFNFLASDELYEAVRHSQDPLIRNMSKEQRIISLVRYKYFLYFLTLHPSKNLIVPQDIVAIWKVHSQIHSYKDDILTHLNGEFVYVAYTEDDSYDKKFMPLFRYTRYLWRQSIPMPYECQGYCLAYGEYTGVGLFQPQTVQSDGVSGVQPKKISIDYYLWNFFMLNRGSMMIFSGCIFLVCSETTKLLSVIRIRVGMILFLLFYQKITIIKGRDLCS